MAPGAPQSETKQQGHAELLIIGDRFITHNGVKKPLPRVVDFRSQLEDELADWLKQEPWRQKVYDLYMSDLKVGVKKACELAGVPVKYEATRVAFRKFHLARIKEYAAQYIDKEVGEAVAAAQQIVLSEAATQRVKAKAARKDPHLPKLKKALESALARMAEQDTSGKERCDLLKFFKDCEAELRSRGADLVEDGRKSEAPEIPAVPVRDAAPEIPPMPQGDESDAS